MALKIVIDDTTVNSRVIPASGDRAEFETHSQSGLLKAGRLTMLCNLRLNKGQTPYAIGEYFIDDESFGTDEYENISIRRGGLKLRPVVATVAREMVDQARKG